MKLKLYDIQQEYIQLAEAIIEQDGEITPEQSDALALNQQNLVTKGTNYAFIIKDLEADNEAIDKEIARLTAFKKSRNKVIDRLKETLSGAMQLYEMNEIKSPVLKIGFRKSESVEIEDESLLASDFIVTKTTTSPDKAKIKEAIKRGEFVVGAVIKTNQNLQIK